MQFFVVYCRLNYQLFSSTAQTEGKRAMSNLFEWSGPKEGLPCGRTCIRFTIESFENESGNSIAKGSISYETHGSESTDLWKAENTASEPWLVLNAKTCKPGFFNLSTVDEAIAKFVARQLEAYAKAHPSPTEESLRGGASNYIPTILTAILP